MKKQVAIVLAIGIAILAFFFVGAVLCSAASNAIDNLHWQGSALPPCFVNAQSCGGHVLGTDEIGRDLLGRLIVGGATTLGWSLIVLAFEAVFVTLVGLAAHFGGRAVRYAALRVASAISALPPWPALVLFILLWHRVSFTAVAALIAPTAVGFALGSSPRASLADRAARDWQRIIVLMATIDFFGYGVQPPTASWGNMLVDAQVNMQIAWWAAVFPAVAITCSVLTIELCRRSVLHGGMND
jgi:peptide/nickel transport system permease protein